MSDEPCMCEGQVIAVQPGDAVLLLLPEADQKVMDRAKEHLDSKFPRNEILIIGGDKCQAVVMRSPRQESP